MAKVKPVTKSKSKPKPAAKPSKGVVKKPPVSAAAKGTKPPKSAGKIKPPIQKKPANAAKGVSVAKPRTAGKVETKPIAGSKPAVSVKAIEGKGSAKATGNGVATKTAPVVVVVPPPVVVTPSVLGTGVTDPNRPKMSSGLGQQRMKRPKIKKQFVMPSLGEPLIKAGKKPKPLIASGPNAPTVDRRTHTAPTHDKKTHLNKKELDRYREILTRKRAELVGDVSKMEGEALTGNSGSLSHLPQHVADQGSDTYEQSLSLGLAQVDRNLIKEIDDALARIENMTFGVCEMTGKPINKERLEELPWTRYSIEAARAKERRQFIS